MKRLALSVSAAALMLNATAHADGTYPRLTADFTIEVESDYTFQSTDPAAELSDTYTTIEAALGFEITDQTSLNATLVFEPVLDPVDDRFFEDHGLYVSELFLQHEVYGVGLTLGKFGPAFGQAWDSAPGLYGTTFAEDYEISERLGGAITIPFDGFGGEHEVAFATFAADTTVLSDSLFQDRGRVQKRDGGVSNTQSPESFALALSGEFGDTGYNAGVQYQSRGTGDSYDQTGVVFGVSQAVPLSDELAVDLLAEAAWFPHFDGAEESAFVGTIGAAAPIGPVTVSGVYALRDVEAAPTDHLGTVSAEIELTEGLSAGVGYAVAREGSETSHIVGALLVYEFGVSTE